MFNLFHPPIVPTNIMGLVGTLANTVNNVIIEATQSSIEEIRETLESKGLLTSEVDAVLIDAFNRGPAKHHMLTATGIPKTRSYGTSAPVSAETEAPVKVRKPRKPTPYNVYIQTKIAELKTNNTQGLVGKQFMKAAIELWNAEKATNNQPALASEEPVKKRRGRPPKNAVKA